MTCAPILLGTDYLEQRFWNLNLKAIDEFTIIYNILVGVDFLNLNRYGNVGVVLSCCAVCISHDQWRYNINMIKEGSTLANLPV